MADPCNLNRLTPAEQQLLLDEVDRREMINSRAHERLAERYPIVHADTVMHLDTPSGTVAVPVLMRNLSRLGCSFLYGRFVYPKSKCAVQLKTLDGESVLLPGVIVRCVHVRGWAHEFGVQFNNPIEVGHFIAQAGAAAINPATDPYWQEGSPLISRLKGAVDQLDWLMCRSLAGQIQEWAKGLPRPENREAPPAQGAAGK